ncbi:unnamed protein product [Caenorhabditis bovis]|uniref:Mediator of RNA polymerase II transcription subunit 22 n=1 Tax=Caenorhabditis bovis TaxID=2654633 RepID=A0A8S1F2M3_9PELO|nr:unnamed protein product [Caenorhabditis bovis]
MNPVQNTGGKKSRAVATKQLIIQEFKRRLRDNIKSLNDNFFHIVTAAKVNTDENSHKNLNGKMTEFYTTKNEMAVRAQLMVRASDELLKLTNDLKEFLILHDFNFLTHSIKTSEKNSEELQRQQTEVFQSLHFEINNMIYDLDQELAQNFQLRY